MVLHDWQRMEKQPMVVRNDLFAFPLPWLPPKAALLPPVATQMCDSVPIDSLRLHLSTSSCIHVTHSEHAAPQQTERVHGRQQGVPLSAELHSAHAVPPTGHRPWSCEEETISTVNMTYWWCRRSACRSRPSPSTTSTSPATAQTRAHTGLRESPSAGCALPSLLHPATRSRQPDRRKTSPHGKTIERICTTEHPRAWRA